MFTCADLCRHMLSNAKGTFLIHYARKGRQAVIKLVGNSMKLWILTYPGRTSAKLNTELSPPFLHGMSKNACFEGENR